jgi:hypothetical protein
MRRSLFVNAAKISVERCAWLQESRISRPQPRTFCLRFPFPPAGNARQKQAQYAQSLRIILRSQFDVGKEYAIAAKAAFKAKPSRDSFLRT